MVGLTCTACLPMRNDASDFDPDNFDPDNPNSNPNVNPEEFELFGTKVLYHPSNYTYDGGEGASTDYFGQYSFLIMDALASTYGRFNEAQASPKYVKDYGQFDYFYDSIRYNLNRQDEYMEKHTVKPLTESETVPPEADGNHVQDGNGNWYVIDDSVGTDFSPYATIYVDTDLGWNWRFNSQITPYGYIYEQLGDYEISINNNIISQSYQIVDGIIPYFNNLSGYYTRNYMAYTAAFAGTLDPADAKASNFSDLTKALKYVLYCVSMNMTPENIVVDSSDPDETRVTIGNFESVDAAVEYAEDLFSQYGLYVGISEYGRQQLVDYILNNVIGERAINADSVAINKYAVYSYTDAEGKEVEFYKLIESAPALQIDRQYESAVENIVTALFEDVDIGADNDKINNKYLASHFRDYFGYQFSTSADDGNEFGEKDGAVPQEYQSILLMPREDLVIEDLTLEFKYVGNLDSITIRVHINAYLQGVPHYDLGVAQFVVKKGEYDYNPDLDVFDIPDEGYLVRKFDTRIMHPDDMVYNGTMEKSQEMKITGSSPYRRIYEAVETENGQCYGRINHEQYLNYCESIGIGRDQDYFEICFEIVNKTPFGANGVRNDYTFYTGLTIWP